MSSPPHICGGFASVRIVNGRATKAYKESNLIGSLGLIVEMTVLRAAEHPHIVPLQEVDADSVALHLDAFDRSMHRVVIENPSAFFSITRQLVLATAHLHARGFLHRDIKPGNILARRVLSKRPHVVLADFNSACRVLPGRCMTVETTTKPYSPPEALMGWQGPYSFERDSWSLGISLLEISTGAPLLYGAGASDDLSERHLLSRIRTMFGSLPTCAVGSQPTLAVASCEPPDICATVPHQSARRVVRSLLQVQPHLRAHPVTLAQFVYSRPAPPAPPAYVLEPRPVWTASLIDGVNEHMRTILRDWLRDVSVKFKYDSGTFASAMCFVDVTIESLECLSRLQLQCVGAVALYLAGVMNEHMPAPEDDFVLVADGAFVKDEMNEWAKKMLALNGDSAIPPLRWVTVQECWECWCEKKKAT
tara:strand:- start:4538 stop:5797 length:1260 start_codon:yes stop_codon:yes gene_type:complete